MNKRGKTIAVVVGLGILGIGGLAIASGGGGSKPGRYPRSCAPGMKWSDRLGRCVPVECPAGFHREGNRIDSDCVADDDPSVKFCPVGQHWDDDRGECVSDTDPTDCPPDQVFDVSTQSCKLKPNIIINPACQAGERWDAELEQCVPIAPGEECPEGTHFVPAPFGPGGSCIPDDVLDIDDYIKNFPTDGAFYQIKAGDFPGWATAGLKTKSVAQNQLGSALLAAAREYGGLDGPAALKWANDRRVNQSHTNRIYTANLCCGWNDMTTGTFGYCGDVAAAKLRCEYTARQKPAPTGRAIRYLKMHADNIERLKAGLAPARVVGIGSANKAGDGLPTKAVAAASPGGKTSYPTQWLVGINRRVLWESDGAVLEFDEDRSLPPDFVMERGFENYAGAAADLPKYGCNSGGYNGEVVV